MTRLLSNRWTIFWLVVPGLVLFLGVVLLPIIMAVYFGMTDWNGLGNTYDMVGLSNYVQLLGDSKFWISIRNSAFLAGFAILIQHPVAMLVARMIQLTGKWEKYLRTMIFIPSIISVFVTANMWVDFFQPQFGAANKILGVFGIPPQQWLGVPGEAIACIIFVCLWQGFGYCFLLYYAGMQAIPTELHEAAVLDGANEWQYGKSIVVPLLTPVIRINVVLAVIAALQQANTVYIMTPNGGPDGTSTLFLGLYLYLKQWGENMYGYGSAISVLFVIVCLVATVLMNKFIKRDVGELA